MQIILQKAVINDVKIKSYITKLTVNELNNLSEPCYYPDWKKHFYELTNMTQLKEKDLKEFISRFYAGTKAQDSLLQSDAGSNLLIILMYYFLTKKDQTTFNTFMIYHMIRQYGNFIRRMLKFCKPEVFSYTLENLNLNHLFSREKTISNALFYLAREMNKRYLKFFLDVDAEKISAFLYESRGRIAQSLKSFAELYYKFEEEGLGITSSKETEDGKELFPEEVDSKKKIAELVSSKMCVYKETDYKAFDSARKLTKINSSIATILVNKIQDTNLSQDVKFVIELFLKDSTKISEICGKDFEAYVRKLMSLKRTVKSVYFKQELNSLFNKIIKQTKYESVYNKLTNQTKFQFNLFLAYYIGFYIRNLVC